MAALILLLVATIKLTTAQQVSTAIPLVALKGNGRETCLSLKERENGYIKLRGQVKNFLENYKVIPECGDGLWYRVAYLNMTDPSQQCPSSWRLYNDSGVRACGGPVTSEASCAATSYPTGRQYSKVCGRVTGFQVGSPGAFVTPSSLYDIYVDGVSITHGNPRSHIWTFAAGVTEGNYERGAGPDCPCSRQGAREPPSYVGNNYYCESGNNGTTFTAEKIYIGDPLWDGKQCEGQCCSNGKSPPWFSVELPISTTDDIEVRICADEGTNNEDTPVSLVEIYIRVQH